MQWHFDKPARKPQVETLKKSENKKEFGHFLWMRLGKTMALLNEFVDLYMQEKVKWLLIICPNFIKTQWAEEIHNCGITLPVHIYNSQNAIDVVNFYMDNNDGGIVIINFESVRAFVENEIHKLYDTNKALIAADESTCIKNPSAKSTKACIALGHAHAYKRILTGKPTANNNGDLWPQLEFLGVWQKLLDANKMYSQRWNAKQLVYEKIPLNYNKFMTYFTTTAFRPGSRFPKRVSTNTQELYELIEPFVYISKERHIEGIEKMYMPPRQASMTPKQKELYKRMEREFIASLAEQDFQTTAPIILTQYLRLQQIASGFITDGDKYADIMPWEQNPRIKMTVDIVRDEIPNKCIIVARFKRSLLHLRNALADYNPLVLEGDMKQHEIDRVKKRFNQDGLDGCRVLLAQIQVLKYGHTLCGDSDNDPCDAMIFYENNFSILDRAQAEERTNKYGRNITSVYFDYFVSRLDRYMIECLRNKEEGSLALLQYSKRMAAVGGLDWVSLPEMEND
jgi:hypothetical protein